MGGGRRRMGGARAALAVALATLAGAAPARAATPPPSVPLASYVVIDDLDGHVLAQHDADVARPIASLTKMMTAHLVLLAGHLDRVVTVDPAATRIGESVVGLRAGERLTRRKLLEGLLVWSGNDAAEALAIDVAGSEAAFATRMNREARRLHLRHSSYVTPYGLDRAGQQSSARDQSVLARLLLADPVTRAIVRLRSTTFEGRELPNRNNLLRTYAGADGVKTGHTGLAGWCLAASATRAGRTVLVVGLGAPDEGTRDRAIGRLLDWAFARFARVRLVRAGATLAELPAAYRDRPVPVVAGRAVAAVVRDDERVRARIVLPERAPVGSRGDVVGRIDELVGHRRVGSAPLRLGADNPAPDLLDRLGWIGGHTVDRLLDPGSWF